MINDYSSVWPYADSTTQGVGQDAGTLPRAIDVIFNSLDELQTKKFRMKPDKLNGFEVQVRHLLSIFGLMYFV